MALRSLQDAVTGDTLDSRRANADEWGRCNHGGI